MKKTQHLAKRSGNVRFASRFKQLVSLVITSFLILQMAVVVNSQEHREGSEENPTKQSSLPNVVLIVVDDLGWSDVGFNGTNFYSTPNIDALAKSGAVFTRSYSCGPNCAPSRASMLSGTYTPRHGVFTVGNSDRGVSGKRKLIPTTNNTVLDGEFISIAELFKSSKYQTAFFGKWHVGKADMESGPTSQGFDLNIAGNHSGHPASYFSPYKNPQISNGPDGEYLTDRLTSEAIDYIDNHHDKPFFAMVSFYSVHTPIQAKPQIVAKYQTPDLKTKINPKYAAMIESVDEGVGRIMQCLTKNGVVDNTMIIFTSDNGGLGSVTSNEPLRGSKGMLYEGGIRVPTAIRWPGKIAPETSISVPIIGVDYFATFADLLKIDLDSQQPLDGKSILPLLQSDSSVTRKAYEQRAIYWHFPAYLQGNNAKGARDNSFRTRPCGAIVKSNWKLIEYFEDGHIELYDLSNDIAEQHELAEAQPEKAKELLRELRAWRENIGASIPEELNPDFAD